VPLPSRIIREAVGALTATWSNLHVLEQDHGLDITRRPDPGLVDAVHRWANGATLLHVLTHTDITAGDFVRWTRQVIDLLGQLATCIDPGQPLSARAREAADLLNRGVVAYSGAL
jgi:ATP-dependent RNA helicase HelY